jgi:hypothetical protein
MKSSLRRPMNTLPRTVRAALEGLNHVPEPDSQRWDEMRFAYLAEVHRYAPLYQQSSTDPLAVNAVPFPPIPRRKGWSPVKTCLSLNLKEGTAMAVAFKMVLVLGLVLGGSVGGVAASRESLPGSPLYPVKLQLEAWEMARAGDAENVVRLALIQLQTRLQEARRLVDKGQSIPNEVEARFWNSFALALQASEELEEAAKVRIQAQIAEMLTEQLQAMTRLRMTRNGGEDDALQAMIRRMETAQRELRQARGDPNIVPGPNDGDSMPDLEEASPDVGAGPGDGDGVPDVEGDPPHVSPGPTTGPGNDENGSRNDGTYEPSDDDQGYGPGPAYGTGGDEEIGHGSGPGPGEGDGVPDLHGDGPNAGPGPQAGPGHDDDSNGVGNGNEGGDGANHGPGPGGPAGTEEPEPSPDNHGPTHENPNENGGRNPSSGRRP